jgi:hypothetical protein
MKSLFKWLIAVGIAVGIVGTIMWILCGEAMKDMACPNGHCSKNGRLQCE